MESRTTIAHADRTKLTAVMPVVKPTTLLAIPRVFEKVYAGAYQKAVDGGKGHLFEKATAVAKEYSRALDKPGGPGLGLKLKHKLWDVLVYSKIRAAIGGECNSAVSGGAALGPELGHFFRGAGVTIYEGYGLTETSPVLSLNLQTAIKVGSIGRPTPGTALKVADDGELLAKGPQVFPGYWNNDAATAEVLDADGWFSTGDIAEIDDDGYVTITGRKKDILVTAGGKNVAPGPLEKILDAHPLIAYAMVVGEAPSLHRLPHLRRRRHAPRLARPPRQGPEDADRRPHRGPRAARGPPGEGRRGQPDGLPRGADQAVPGHSGRTERRRRGNHSLSQGPPAHCHGKILKRDQRALRDGEGATKRRLRWPAWAMRRCSSASGDCPPSR